MRILLAIVFLGIFACNQQQQTKAIQSGSDSSNKTISANVEDTADAILSINRKIDTVGEYQRIVASLSGFILDGYSVLDTCSGDLNRDQFTDMILVLRKNGEDSTSDVVDHPEKRPLLILLGQPDHTLRLSRRNDNSVLCVDCGGIFGDPFAGIVIKNGFFTVEHYGGSNWRWSRDITYKYVAADNNWYLHKISTQSYHNSDPDKVDTRIYTVKDFGKQPFEKFDIFKDE